MSTDKINNKRPSLVGPDEPESPYPICCDTIVIPGFGRGSADLGIPTANIPQDKFDELDSIGSETGVYYGWALVSTCSGKHDERFVKRVNCDTQIEQNFGAKLASQDLTVLPMVMSVGWNPFYGNKKKSAEIHIIHKFENSFYGAQIKFMILGYIRAELNYTTKETLIQDINTDIQVAINSLSRDGYQKYKQHEFFTNQS